MRRLEPGTLLHSTGTLGLTAVLNRLSSLGLLVVLARALGQGAVAYYGLATLTASFLSLGASLGLTTYTTRAVAAGELDRRQLRAVHTARAAILVVGVAALAAASTAVVDARYATGFTIFAVAAVLDQWNETAWPVVRATDRALRESAVTVSTSVCAVLVVGAVWLSSGLTFDTAALVWLGFAALRSLLAGTATGIWPGSGPSEIRAVFPGAVRRALPYLGSDILGLAYLRGDTFVLAFFVSSAMLGDYVSASSYVIPLVQVCAAMSLGALATMGRDGAGRDTGGVVVFFLRAGLAIPCLLVVVLPVAVVVMYGHGHTTITVLALVLCGFVPMRFGNSALSAILIVLGGVRFRLVVVVLSVAVNVALNLALDGSLGARGAALSTVLTEAFVSLSFLFFLRRVGSPVAHQGLLWAIAGGGTLYALAVSLPSSSVHHVLLAVVCFLVLHLVLLLRVAVRPRSGVPASEGIAAHPVVEPAVVTP